MREPDTFGFVNYLVGLGLADRTITVYSHAVERWLIHCGRAGVDPMKATPVDMRTYSESIPDTHASRRQHAVALGHWFRWRGVIDDPTGAIRKPRRRRMKWNGIESDAAAAVVQVSRGVHPEGTAALFGLLMGLRRAEIAAVDWTRFDPTLEWYTVHGKGNIVEDIPVHPIVRDEIAGRQTAFRYLFPGQRTAHVNPATVAGWIADIGTAAGIVDLTPHKLRHTFISDVNDVTGDLRVAQELARHASPETTAGYTRVTRKRMVTASQALSYAPVRAAVNE